MMRVVGPEDYRFPREPGTTEAGYPWPFSGKPITKTPIVAESGDASRTSYPEHYIAGRETLAEDEMRITWTGSFGPEFAEKNHIPVANSSKVMNQHTTPAELGRVFDLAKPRLGVGMHLPLGGDSRPGQPAEGKRPAWLTDTRIRLQ